MVSSLFPFFFICRFSYKNLRLLRLLCVFVCGAARLFVIKRGPGYLVLMRCDVAPRLLFCSAPPSKQQKDKHVLRTGVTGTAPLLGVVPYRVVARGSLAMATIQYGVLEPARVVIDALREWKSREVEGTTPSLPILRITHSMNRRRSQT